MKGDRARLGAIALGLHGASAVTARSVRENRVELQRGPDLTEWYQQGPLGLEQGFDVAKGSASIVLHVAVTGAAPVQAGDGEIALVQGARVVARYGEAYAVDAKGRALGVKLVAENGGIEIRVAADGAVFPVEIDPVIWVEQAELLASDGVTKDSFGISVAASGNTALVGAGGKNTSTGAAYVFVRSGAAWTQQRKLVATNGATGDGFGDSVALSGDTAFVGAPGWDNTIVGFADMGATYVFVRSGTTWGQPQSLIASDGATGDHFGVSVALSNDTALIGASSKKIYVGTGAAYVFVRSGTKWTRQDEFVASDGAVGDSFGNSLALSGNTALVAAAGKNSSTGAAYVFVRSGTWTQQQKLLASDAATNDRFGSSVALSGNIALVGASWKNSYTGAAYVFVRSGAAWTQQQKLLAKDAATNDRFGSSVALSGNTALVGAPNESGYIGAVYVFLRSGAIWTQQQKLVATDGVSSDSFGSSVGLSSDTALVGAFMRGTFTGAAYAFIVNYPTGSSCPAGGPTFCASGFCVDGYCCDNACNQPCQTCSATPGTCTAVAKGTASTCGAYVCNGVNGACPSACTDDSTCAAGYYCNANGTCVAQKAQGKTCNASGDCKSSGCRVCSTGNCVDGVCCDTACNGTCQTCSAAKKGSGTDGTCGNVADGTDPDSECAPNTCHAGQCASSCTTSADCAKGTVCVGGGCITPAAQGATCTSNLACQSGNCVDGVCCDTTCTGQCEACDGPTKGTCSPITGQPHGTVRAPCKGDGSKCSGACDGKDRTQCQYLAAGKVCGTDSCSNGSAQTSACDGQGTCAAEKAQPCSPYVCGADACLATCTKDTDCATGYECKSGACTPASGAHCSTDGNSSIKADGTVTPCMAYTCDPTSGACNKVCSNGSTDCATGYACDPTSKTCVKTSGGSSNSSGGCGCRAAGGTRSSGAPWLLLLGVGLLVARRRR
jgi:MYXO-CTERM domain-containing protein